MDSCEAYVSMLQARRAEEEASRAVRAQRRADVVITNSQQSRQRCLRARRRVMDEKLHMTSQVERDLFSLLDEQSKWRHVMFQSVLDRDEQHRSVREKQQNLEHGLLEAVKSVEQQIEAEIVRDDTTRWKQLLQTQEEERRGRAVSVCQGVLDDVIALGAHVVNFIEMNDLRGAPPNGRKSTFDAVPQVLYADWKRKLYVRDEAVAEADLVSCHLSLGGVYSTQPLLEEEIHNPLLCSLIHKMLSISFPTPSPSKPHELEPKALVVVLGPKYSGKSTASEIVADELHLLHTTDVELVERALKEISRDLDAADLESESVCALLELGREVRQVLSEGEVVSDELLSKLLLNQISSLPKEYRGVLLDGVPRNRRMFEIVEQELSGYNTNLRKEPPKKILAPPLRSANINHPSLVVEKPEVAAAPLDAATSSKEAKKAEAKAKKDKKRDEPEDALPPIELPAVEPIPPLTDEEAATLRAAENHEDTSAFHRVLHLNASADEIFRRFAGLREDPETGKIYHLDIDPPPMERLPFLRPRNRCEADTVKLHRSLALYDDQWAAAQDWLRHFPDIVENVDANACMATVLQCVREHVTAAVEKAQKLYEVHAMADRIKSERTALQQLFAERTETRENVRKQLAQIYLERGVDPLPPELMDPPKAVEEGSKAMPIPPALPNVLLGLFDDFSAYFSSSILRVHVELARAMESVFAHGRNCVSQYQAFWRQPDPKEGQLASFAAEFNTMQAPLRRDIQGKEELHLRTDALSETLWCTADKRRETVAALIEGLVAKAAFLDGWSDIVRALGGALVQLECERFFLAKHLATLYFGALRGEASAFDEAELSIDVIPLPRGTAELSTPDPGATKASKDKKPPPKKGAAAPPPGAAQRPNVHDSDVQEHKSEDLFAIAVERSLTMMKGSVERLQLPPTPATTTKGAATKKAAAATEPPPNEPAPIGVLAMPVIAPELELAKQRITCLATFVRKLLDEGAERNSALKDKLQQLARKQCLAEVAAINAAIFHIRCAIEEERPLLHRVVLSGTTFAIDRGHPLVDASLVLAATTLKPSRPDERVEAAMLTSTLSVRRAHSIIKLLKEVAPDYALHRDDFVRVFKIEDYACAAPQVVPLSTLFDRFDILRSGVIDWREVIVHLLLWCEPEVSAVDAASVGSAFGISAALRNPWHVEGPTYVQLLDSKAEFGQENITPDDFDEIPLFFEEAMSSEERAHNYRSVLWATFANAEDRVDPTTMLLFWCPDAQPLRGVQKAFGIASKPLADRDEALTLESLSRVFHHTRSCASAVGMQDPYDQESLIALFSPPSVESVTFQDVCATHVGRLLLNNADMYHRRSFV